MGLEFVLQLENVCSGFQFYIGIKLIPCPSFHSFLGHADGRKRHEIVKIQMEVLGQFCKYGCYIVIGFVNFDGFPDRIAITKIFFCDLFGNDNGRWRCQGFYCITPD